jgi:Dolichyl-phosphate-mannose-protein mannosyltransferase
LLAAFLRVYLLHKFPPGLYWDEAFDGFDAWRLLTTASHPVFFDGNTGREPLTIYLQAGGILLWGLRDWTLRIVPALIGIASVPMLFRLTATLYGEDARGKAIGALAAGMLAVSFWHVAMSRLALRAISFPLLSMITLWLFWRAWRSQRVFDFALSGAALGLTLYTYLASRLLPIVILSFALAAAVLSLWRRDRFPRFHFRSRLVGLSVMMVVMLIVFIPIGVYFLQNPGAFFLRASYISIFSGDGNGLASLPFTTLATIRMFVDRGDMEILRNLPGRPVFDWLTTLGFWVGLAIALARFTTRPLYLLLLLWFGINLGTTLFSLDIPNFMRTSGALIPATILAADGLTSLWERFVPKTNPVSLFLLVVAVGGALTFNDYFNIWGPSQATFNYFDGSWQTVLDRAISLTAKSDVVLPFWLYSTPNAQIDLAGRFATDEALQTPRNARPTVWIVMGGVERDVVVLQPDGHVLVPAPLDDVQVAVLGRLLDGGQPVTDRFGRRVASEVLLDDQANVLSPIEPTHPLDVIFGGQLRLLGYDLDPPIAMPGDQIRVTYYWQSLVDSESEYLVASNLLDAFSNAFRKRVSEPANAMAPTSLWGRGEVVLDSQTIKVPKTAHPGKYRFEVEIISPDAPDSPLAMSQTEDRLFLDPFTIASQAAKPNTSTHPLAIAVGEPRLATLIGYDLASGTVPPGKPLHVTLYWRADRPAPTDYSVFLHLLDAEGHMVAQQDGPPQNGNAPTSWWQPGDLIPDAHALSIPSGIRPGTYVLAIGIYDSLKGPRLPLFDAAGKPIGDSWELPIEIAAP